MHQAKNTSLSLAMSVVKATTNETRGRDGSSFNSIKLNDTRTRVSQPLAASDDRALNTSQPSSISCTLQPSS